MNTHYGIPAALVAQWESADAAVKEARAEYDADPWGETWEAYETTVDAYSEAAYEILQAWLAAWRAEAVPAAVEAGLTDEEYETAARRFRMRAALDGAIENAYFVHGYGVGAVGEFYAERIRMERMATECEAYVAARREQAEAEAERERLLVEWAKLPVAERKSSHPLFRARVDCCTRSEEARQRWFLSRLCRHELPVEARALWLTMENQLYIARQSAGGAGWAVAAEIRRRCAEAGAIGAEVLRYARLDTATA
jgi:hypothetical protein